ncbi:MBL fold metallo-hydrolase [Allonocardiopsis opalescens]|uniref:Glyoxylase-like metal-dependent hydrolase (Beta-lactamase superfamily II) n=1 Tax=Allonocardiopsis opalescens TaxID=1144618 RepID=A0A2T0Q6Q5_9ACTN|nr:MBL fold metallo-hydrolase [Allonocardiopsis opalescens]PRX99484.1 glyoxylase-like metal-dependent hydrolase (beta-lactamase superfamily II) [Allonocardiopsis opalescens]
MADTGAAGGPRPAPDRDGIDGSGTDRARCVLADNPGPMTLTGTNTWILAEPGASSALVVDPGPDDPAHLRRVLAALDARGLRPAAALLTHRHLDHSGGARRFHELTGAPVRALDPHYRFGAEGLTDGDVIEADGLELRVVGAPGHTSDSLAFHLPADGALLTGDTVLGRGTTVIAPDGGSLGDYLASMERLRALAASTGMRALLPGHGPLSTAPLDLIDAYLRHRTERLAEIRAAIAAGARTDEEVVAAVYHDVDDSVLTAALFSVRAQLDYLRERGEFPPRADAPAP